jgi:hypothetical protein
MIGGSAMPLCWPAWEQCQPLLSVPGVNRVLWLYLALSIGAAIAFARRRVGAGCSLLLASNVLRTLIMVQDRRYPHRAEDGHAGRTANDPTRSSIITNRSMKRCRARRVPPPAVLQILESDQTVSVRAV